MVVFHSYVSLPEGTTCSPASRRSLGPERHVVYWVSLAERSCGSKPRRLATWFTSRGYPWPLQCPRDKLVITIVFMGIISWFMLQSHVYIYIYPVCSMVLLYLPTKLGNFVRANVGKYSSIFQHHGAYGYWNWAIATEYTNLIKFANFEESKKNKQTIKQG